MNNPMCKIQITAKGPLGSGKSLAISDMIRGLRDYGHFIVTPVLIGTAEGEEYQEIEVQIKEYAPMDHYDD